MHSNLDEHVTTLKYSVRTSTAIVSKWFCTGCAQGLDNESDWREHMADCHSMMEKVYWQMPRRKALQRCADRLKATGRPTLRPDEDELKTMQRLVWGMLESTFDDPSKDTYYAKRFSCMGLKTDQLKEIFDCDSWDVNKGPLLFKSYWNPAIPRCKLVYQFPSVVTT